MRVLLILVDGMIPDSLKEVEKAQEIIHRSAATMHAQTVMPSVTLPCHMSLFHSVDPERHGTTTNDYAPQVRPIDGLCEVLTKAGKKCAFFYDWLELRDLTRPGSLQFAYYWKGGPLVGDVANNHNTDAAIKYLNEVETDFAFLYMGFTDESGHKYGFLSPEYMKAMQNSWENIDRVIRALPDDYQVIITADHGGHARTHGTEMPCDMTIPVIACGSCFTPGEITKEINIKDIAPTITELFAIEPNADWDGKSFL